MAGERDRRTDGGRGRQLRLEPPTCEGIHDATHENLLRSMRHAEERRTAGKIAEKAVAAPQRRIDARHDRIGRAKPVDCDSRHPALEARRQPAQHGAPCRLVRAQDECGAGRFDDPSPQQPACSAVFLPRTIRSEQLHEAFDREVDCSTAARRHRFGLGDRHSNRQPQFRSMRTAADDSGHAVRPRRMPAFDDNRWQDGEFSQDTASRGALLPARRTWSMRAARRIGFRSRRGSVGRRVRHSRSPQAEDGSPECDPRCIERPLWKVHRDEAAWRRSACRHIDPHPGLGIGVRC